MKTTLLLLTLLLSIGALAAPFDSLVFDQDVKGNLKKLTKLGKLGGPRLLWWNVAWGKYNGDHDLDKNLLGLLASPLAPDFIALGEFKPVVLKEETRNILAGAYPYSAFVPYTPDSEVGVTVYSKFSFTQSEVHNLDWSPLRSTVAQATAYREDWLSFDPNWAKYWDRSFAFYTLFLGEGKSLSIAPVHLASPWSSVHKRHGNWKTLRIMMGAKENPLLHQQERLLQTLRRDFGPTLNHRPLVLLGDFNVPSKVPIPVVGGTPKMYKLLKGDLEKVLDSGDDTFPTKSTAFDQTGLFKKHEVQLDHVFHNEKAGKLSGEVLHLKGSDHYPILSVFE